MFNKRIIAAHIEQVSADRHLNLNGKRVSIKRLALDWLIMALVVGIVVAVLLIMPAKGAGLNDYVYQNNIGNNGVALQLYMLRREQASRDWYDRMERLEEKREEDNRRALDTMEKINEQNKLDWGFSE